MRLSNKAPLSPAERQKRYRASRDLLSIDIRRETVEALSKLRVQTGLATDAVIKAALLALTERLNKKAPSRRRTASSQGSLDLGGLQNS
jgi:hypothetical protein